MFHFDLLENEKLIAIHRQTEWVLARTVFIVFVLIYLPWFFLIKYEMVAGYVKLLASWTVAVFLYAVYKYLLWLLNVYILTDKRLVSVRYFSLLRKKVLESPLDMVANVSFSTSGIASSMLDYGDVLVQVANLADPVILENVRNPARIKDSIWKLNNKNRRKIQEGSHTIIVPSADKHKTVK